jgi:hypothetical protein
MRREYDLRAFLYIPRTLVVGTLYVGPLFFFFLLIGSCHCKYAYLDKCHYNLSIYNRAIEILQN